MEEIKQVPNGADIPHLNIKMPSLNGEQLNPEKLSWEIVLWVYSNKGVKVRYNAISKTTESIGEIHANCDLGNSSITLYIKSSEESFGRGQMKGQMTLYIPDTKYKEEEQVGKTLETLLGIQIV